MTDAGDPLTCEAAIIGAGPAGLWAAFQLGLHGVRSVILDSHDTAGGQCAALYADKPVYDLPGFAGIDAGDIAQKLLCQIERFQPQWMLGECVASVWQMQTGFVLSTRAGTQLQATYVVLASGLGPFGLETRVDPLELPPSVIIDNGHPAVTQDGFQTSCPGLYAIGDAIGYPGKLSLLVSAFHEAALMAFAIRKARAGGKRQALEYSSTASSLKALFTDR